MSQALQPLDQVARQLLALAAVEVVPAEFLIDPALLEDVVGDVQQAMRHPHQRPLPAPPRRQAARRGRKRALVGVAHSLVHIIYHILKEGRVHQELGGDYFDRLQGDRLARHLVKRLESLGHRVILEPVPRAG